MKFRTFAPSHLRTFAPSHLRTFAVLVCLVAVIPASALGQGRQANPNPPPNPPNPAELTRQVERLYAQTLTGTPVASDVLTGPVVTDAPFSADATTNVTQVLGDGTRIEQSTTARFFRDRAGRVRREQTILGLGALNAAGGNLQTITVDPDPGDGTAYTLDPMTRTARRVPRMAAAGFMITPAMTTALRTNVGISVQTPGARIGGPQPVNKSTEESLGTRQIEGVKATGRKTTTIIPTGQIGNDRPIEITDERWESPELKMLVYSRNSDPRTGVVEYRLTNINRSEPPADLFVVPSDYTISEPTAGGRGGPRSGGSGTGGR
jgi:hypothetical protein